MNNGNIVQIRVLNSTSLLPLSRTTYSAIVATKNSFHLNPITNTYITIVFLIL